MADDEHTAAARAAANVIPMRGQPGASAPPAPKKHADKLLFFGDIEPVTNANDFVENLLTSQGMSVIYGETTAGKTFFATDLALHVACGWPWNGRETVRGAVLYCALEGSHGISNRIAAFKQHYGITSLPFAVLPVAVDMLNSAGDVEGVLEAITKIKEVTGLDVVLTVMDTLSRAMVGGNENSPDDMGAVVMNGTRIQQEGHTHVAWVHHTGKDQAKGARGHSLLRAATDTEIEVVVDEAGNRTARVTKQREIECEGEFNFTLKVIELGTNQRGKPITSCIVDYGNDAPAVARQAGPKSGHTKRALEILTDIIAASGQSGFAGAPPNVPSIPDKWWREQFYQRAMPAAEPGAKQRAFHRAADALVERHLVGLNAGRVWLGRKTDD